MTATDVVHLGLEGEQQTGAVGSRPAGRQAIKDAAPFAVALIPFGMAIGGASSSAGLSAAESAFGAVVLLAGAAQLAAVESIGSDRGIVVTAMIVALINLRFVFYGAGVKRWFAGASFGRQLLLAFPIVDQTFMLCVERFATETDLGWRQRYYLVATAVLASAFVGSQIIAFHFVGNLPDWLGLHLAAPLAFAGMLAKTATSRPSTIACIAGAVTVLLAAEAAGAVALPLAVVVGVASAMIGERKWS